MNDALIPCEGCARHVRASSDACPFCAAPRVATETPPAPPAPRMSRAMIFALGAALGAAGCEATAVPVYGAPAPPVDAGQDAGQDAGADGGADAVAVRYGAPPPPDAWV